MKRRSGPAAMALAMALGQASVTAPRAAAEEQASEIVEGEVTKIDLERGRVTLRDSNGMDSEFEASAETLKDLRVGDHIEAKRRPGWSEGRENYRRGLPRSCWWSVFGWRAPRTFSRCFATLRRSVASTSIAVSREIPIFVVIQASGPFAVHANRDARRRAMVKIDAEPQRWIRSREEIEIAPGRVSVRWSARRERAATPVSQHSGGSPLGAKRSRSADASKRLSSSCSSRGVKRRSRLPARTSLTICLSLSRSSTRCPT